MKPLPKIRTNETLVDFQRRLAGEEYRHLGDCVVCNYDQDNCNACDGDEECTPDQHACNCVHGSGYGYRLRELIKSTAAEIKREYDTPIRPSANEAPIGLLTCSRCGGAPHMRELDEPDNCPARDLDASPVASDLIRQAAHAANIERARLVVGEINKIVNAASKDLGPAIGMDIVVNFTAGMILDCKVPVEKFFEAIRTAIAEYQRDEN